MAVVWKELAYKDDVATLGTGTPVVTDGGAAAAGSGVTASKIDHKHALGPLVANLGFAGYQAVDMVIEQKSTAPATPVVGKMYQDSDDQKLYVCTSAA
jgi:hypothetical protein